ncbi:ankyrin repeat-containing domain protein [Coniella lustricola]|uniref:Ankyrin repeat-containing domain protein n=1 Tax=Coniella lustricola TaxID=2025994 RepID=A0A2T2ZUM0_9PEZI|nr:ankyrin repeat-containing domain protein [Coniella lustricola]
MESLTDAASAGRLDKLQHLLNIRESSASLAEAEVQELVIAAARNARLDTIRFLFERYPSISVDEYSIYAATYSGSIPLLAIFLDKDPASINTTIDRRGSPLAIATINSRPIEYLKFMLDKGADPNLPLDVAVDTPLAMVAAFYNDTTAVDLLLRHGAKLEHSGALLAATKRNNETMVRYLLLHGADHDTDWYRPDLLPNMMPLHKAAELGHSGIVRAFLEHGAKVDAKDWTNRTPEEVVNAVEKATGKDLSEIKNILDEFR